MGIFRKIDEGLVEDVKARAEAILDMQVTPKLPRAESPGEAMLRVGCCVKSVKRNRFGMPEYHGILAKHGRDGAKVISHDGDKVAFIWSGSATDYYELWDCD